MDFCNGGAVEVTGNVILRYGAAVFQDDNPAIKFGEEQQPTFNASSPSFSNSTENYVHDGRSHSVLLAQNTIRSSQPEGGVPFNVMNVSIPTSEADAPMTVTRTVRNNIVASDNGTAAQFAADYPDNSVVAYGQVNDLGVYAGAVIPGNPAVHDAAYAWAGDYQPPKPRTDSNRGGVS